MTELETSNQAPRDRLRHDLDAVEAPPVHTATAGPDAGPGAHVIGDPLSLGLASFGLAVGAAGVVNAGLVDESATPASIVIALATGFLTQLIAGILGFRRGETFVGVVFTVFSGFWLGISALQLFFVPQIVEAGGSPGGLIGMFLLAWAIVSTYIWIAAIATTKINGVVFGIGTLALLVLGIGAFVGSGTTIVVGGWLQIITGLILLYLSAATIIGEMYGRPILPVV
jgi:uncharacterized protein